MMVLPKSGVPLRLESTQSQFYKDITMPFYGYNRPGANVSEGFRENWLRQGMMGGVKASTTASKAFFETDLTGDPKKIELPSLVMHGEDDQIVTFADAGPLSAKLLKHATIKAYLGFPHGMPTPNAEQINADLLAFVKG